MDRLEARAEELDQKLGYKTEELESRLRSKSEDMDRKLQYPPTPKPSTLVNPSLLEAGVEDEIAQEKAKTCNPPLRQAAVPTKLKRTGSLNPKPGPPIRHP